jgi:primosomal protein N' (replication factor Y)
MGTVEAIEVIEEAIEGIQVEQFDKDSITTAKRLKEALGRFESGESQLLLGTQMLSKGHLKDGLILGIKVLKTGMNYLVSNILKPGLIIVWPL